MKGLLKWDGKILTDNGWFSIRYLKGVATETKQFGMCTKGLLISGNEVNVSREQALEQFFSLITPIFNFLEKNAKWKFAKDSDGNFAFYSKASPEYGADSYVTKVMTDLRGEYFGIPGETKDWYDRSKDADSSGEYETSDPELVEAITMLPQTHSMARRQERKLGELEGKIDTLVQRVYNVEKTIKENRG